VKKFLLGGAVAVVGLAGPVGATAFGGAAPASASPSTSPSAAGAIAALASLGTALSHQVSTLVNVPPLLSKDVLGRIDDSTATSSTNWSGWADINDTFQTVTSSWTEPTVTCTASSGGGGLLGGLLGGGGGGGDAATYSSFWVGLDGYSSSSVEQTGSSADCTSSGPSYYAWYEMYPSGETPLSTTQYHVNPGDTMTGTVSFNAGNNDYTLTLADQQGGWKYSTAIAQSGLARSSAEFIAEAPSDCNILYCDPLPLSNFGTATFFNSEAADGSGQLKPISGFGGNDAAIEMVQNGTVLAQPGALSSTGNGFSVKWDAS
jgi:Peptidase A4 family